MIEQNLIGWFGLGPVWGVLALCFLLLLLLLLRFVLLWLVLLWFVWLVMVLIPAAVLCRGTS